ncbi:MAG: hypothetical protein J5J06_01520 [Phycisphaerae bacterium]|nr:hypothetical protein [Phycisphaerae bacterium]
MIFILPFLFLVGATLLVIGLEGRQVDDYPYCTHCRYNLTGLTANRCPECGTEISRNTVAFGRRERNRPVLIAGGVVLGIVVLTAVSFAVGEIRGVNWYKYVSTHRLLNMAGRDVRSAVDELYRRIQTGALDEAQRQEVIESALARQTANLNIDPRPVWANLLGLLDSVNQLTPEQREAFLGSVAPVRVRVRERVRLGDPAVVEIDMIDRGAPSWTYAADIHLIDLKLSPASVPFSVPLYPTFNLDSRADIPPFALTFPTTNVGHQTATGVIDTTLYDPNTDPAFAKPTWHHASPFSLDYEVLPEDAPDPVNWVDEPERESTIRRAIYPDQVHMQCRGIIWRKCRFIEYIFLERSFDVDLAFEVIFEVGGRKIGGAAVSWANGEMGWRAAYSDDFKPLKTNQVHVVLRATRSAALQSADCYNIWRGEIRIPAVSVTGP